MKIGLLCHNADWRSSQHKAFIEIQAGARALGHEALVCIPPGDGLNECDVIFAWNTSRREWWQEFRQKTLDRGAKFFIMERGWFDRMEYTQIDHEGFNHTASWSHLANTAAPREGVKRYEALCERLSEPKPVECRQSGYVLILGQTSNDTQLRQSEIHHPDALCGSVVANLPAGLEAVFRAHPLSKFFSETIEQIGGTLEDAIAGARFVVTINSNAGNDALWAGCPVLCFGPALYEIAGVARRTNIASLMHDMEMMKRWQPDARRVLSYYHWLASKQWNRKELEQGDCLRQLLGEIDGN